MKPLQRTPFSKEITQPNNSVSYKISNSKVFLGVLKKADRLAAALYILSNLFSDKEPLKWELRDSVLTISKDINKARSTNSDVLLRKLYFEIDMILRMLCIAQIGGLVSQMNFSIFKKEIEEMQAVVHKCNESDNLSEDVSFEDTFFTEKEVTAKDDNDKMSVLYKKIPRNNEYNKTEIQENELLNQKLVNNKQTSDAPFISTTNTTGAILRNERRDKILRFLNNKRDATIKDIASNFSDCSDKTIQRELNTLIKNNLVVRSGKRRWSRYSVA